MEIKGIPPVSVITQGNRWKTFFHSNYKPIIVPNSRNKIHSVNQTPKLSSKFLEHKLKCDDSHFVDFIDKCLEWSVEDRMRPREALQHEWIKIGLEELTKPKQA
jgi:dual specificity tyrosine-phosphorylation-regulated kinase 2/3/4